MTPATVIRRMVARWKFGRGDESGRVSEAGDTLVEVLVAILVLGLATTALMLGFMTSISSSANHKNLATLDASVRTATNEAISLVQQQANQTNGAFSCPDTFEPNSANPGDPFNSSSTIKVTSYTPEYWNGTSFSTSCSPTGQPDYNPQQINMMLTSTNESTPLTTVSTVIYDPSAPPLPANIGAASKLVWLQSPSSGTLNTPVSPQPIVAVEDNAGNIVYSDLSSITLSVQSGPGSLSINCSGVESYGVVPFGDCSLNAVGTYTLNASNSNQSVAAASSTSFSVGAAPAAQLVFTSASISGTATNAATLGPITVQEQDAFGNPTTAGVNFSVSSSSSGGVFSASSGGATTNTLPVSIPAGSSSTTFYYGDTVAGTPTLTAAASGLAPGTQSETIKPGPPTKLAFTSNPFTAGTGTSAKQPFTVAMEDTFGNAATSTTATTVNLTSTSGTGIFAATSGGTTVTKVTIPANNTSIIAYYGDTTSGTVTLTAAATGLISATQTDTMTLSPTKLVIPSTPVSGAATSSATLGPITIEEENGTTPTTVGLTVNLSSTSANGVFSLTSGGAAVTQVTIPGGSSSVNVYYGDTKAGTPTITATSAGLTSATQTETITGGPATQLGFTSTAFSGTANNSATNAFTVSLEDGFGNPTTSTSATTVNLSSNSTGTNEFAATSGGGSVTNVAIPANTASVTAYYGDQKAGNPTLTAAATGLTSGAQTETIRAGTCTQLAITSAPFSGTAGNSATNASTISLEDGFGNLTTCTTTTTVNLSSNSTGTYEFAHRSGGTTHTTTTINAGTTSVTAYYGDTMVGNPVITAAATGLSSGTQTETITAAAASKLVFTTAPVSGSTSNSATVGPITVQEEDAFNNVTTTALTVNLSSSSAGTHEFAATSGGAVITSIAVPGGSSTATFYYGDQKAGNPTLTAAAAGLTSGTQAETITAGSATQLGFTSAPFNGTANNSATNAFTVSLEDGFGNPTTSTSATTVNLSSNSTGTNEFAASSGGGPVTNVTIPANTASVTAYYGDTKAGSPTLTAAATGLTSGTQAETITAGTATQLLFTTAPVSGAASNSATVGPITVQEEDAFNNVSTTALTVNLSSNSTGTHRFAATSGGAAITSIAIPGGSSTATFYYGDQKAGSPTITASAGAGVSSATQTETITAGALAKLGFTSASFSATASASATAAFTVSLEDGFGNPVTTTSATTVNLTSNSTGTNEFAATSGGGSVTNVTIPANTASITTYYGDTKAGSPTLTAAATGLTSGTQAETITAGSATQLRFTSAPFSGTARNSATNAFTVALEDGFGNPTTSTSATTVNLGSNSTGTNEFAASSGGTAVTSVTIPANTTSLTAYYGDQKAGSPTLTAAATGLTSGTQTETITAAAASKLVFTTAPVSGAVSNSATVGPITVQEEDAFNNVTTTALTVNLSSNSTGTHRFAATSGGAAITSIAIPGGSSTATFYYGDTKTGGPTLTAAATGLTSGTQAETITAGTATQLVFTSTAFSGAARNSATNAFTVSLEDGFGNPTTSTSATTVNLSSNSTGTNEFAATSGGGSVTNVTIPANTASVTAYYGDTKAGGPTLTAAATGLTSGTQIETITAGSATQLVFTSTVFSGAARNSATNAFTVSLEDGFGNPTTSASATTVNLSSNSTGTNEFAATSGGGSVTNVTIPANTASVTAYYGDQKAGSPTLTAAATGLTSGTQTETITAAAASKLVFTTAPVSGSTSNSATVGPITVQEEDAFNNVTTTALTVNLSSSSAGTHEFAATSGGAVITSIAVPGGSSTATFYYGDQKAGNPTLTAAAAGLTSGTQAETITAGSATQLGFTSAPFNGTANNSATNAFTVSLEDGFGNPTTSTSATTVNLSSNSTGTNEFAASSGGGPVTNVTIPANTASVTVYYGDTKAGSPTLTAAATGLTSGTQAETITAGTATQLLFTTAPVSGAASNSATVGPITVQEEDAFNNVSTTALTVNLSSNSTGTHRFAATSGGAAITSIAIPGGSSTATFYYGDQKAGSPTIMAAGTGLSAATQVEAITAGAPTQLGFTSTAFSGTANNSPTNAFTVALEDGFGNPTTRTTATTVNLSSSSTGTHEFATSSGGTAVTSVTITANTTSVTAYYGDQKAGTPTITAASGTLTSGTQAETITAGSATQLGFTSAPFSGTTSATATNAFTVALEDGFGNPTTSTSATTVNLTSSSTGTHEFAASSGGTAVTSVTIPANTTSVTAYYGDNKAGNPILTAAATGLTSGTQTETISTPIQTYSGSSNGSLPTGPDYYRIDTTSTGSLTSTANVITPGVAETLRSFTFNINSASGTNHTATIGLITGGTWAATALTCTITGGSGLTSCTVTANVSVSATQSINVRATGNGNHSGTWTTTYTQP